MHERNPRPQPTSSIFSLSSRVNGRSPKTFVNNSLSLAFLNRGGLSDDIPEICHFLHPRSQSTWHLIHFVNVLKFLIFLLRVRCCTSESTTSRHHKENTCMFVWRKRKKEIPLITRKKYSKSL